MRKIILYMVFTVLLISSVYAQWNNPHEQNNTQGFIYLTNLSFQDTFEYYDYNPIWSFQGNDWTMDYESSTAQDVRQGNTGTLNGYTLNHASNHSTHYNATGGYFGGAYEFDGVDDYVDMGDDGFEETICNNGCTISSWINVNSYNPEGTVFSRFDSTGENMFIRLRIHTTGKLYAQISENGSTSGTIQTTGGTVLNKNEWYHVVYLYNGSTSKLGTISLYLNGNFYSESASSIPIDAAQWLDDEHFFIGVYDDGSHSLPFNGSIDEVRIWDKALTQSEIQAEMNSANPVHTEGLVASYSFEPWGKNSTHAYDTNPTVQGHSEDNTTQAMRFDGVDDYVSVSDSDGLDINNTWTIHFWGKQNSYLANAGLISKFATAGDQRSYTVRIKNTNEINMIISNTGLYSANGDRTTTNNCGFTDANWYMIDIIYDGLNFTFYKDGTFCEEIPVSISSTYKGTAPFLIGSYNLVNYFNGSIDDVMIWDRALSQEEITALYTGTATPQYYIYPNDLTATPRWELYHQKNIDTARTSCVLNLTDNGYGFQTNALKVNSTTPFGYSCALNATSYSNYNNYEMIFRMKKSDEDFGSDICRFYATPNTIAMVRQADQLRFNIDGNSYDVPGITPKDDTWTWFRFTHNDSWCSWYYTQYNEIGWTLGYNRTCGTYDIWGDFTGGSTECYLDNFIVRELVPKYTSAGDYHFSGIYDSSNETAQDYFLIKPFKNGVFQETINISTTDFNQTYLVPLNYGIWYFDVDAWSVSGDAAVNRTQHLYVDYAGFYPCSADTGNTINISYYHEDYPMVLIPATLEIEGTSQEGANPEKTFNFSYAAAKSHMICIEPPDATLQADIYAQYTATGGFTHRYYIVNGTFTNATQYISAYNFNTTTGKSDLKITLRDQSTYLYMKNIIGKLQRRYVGEATWRTVQMDETGDFGQLFYNIIEESKDYRIIFIDRGNNILETTQSMKFICEAGICEVIYLLEPYVGGTSTDNLTITTDYDNTTGIITVNWQDNDWIPVTINTVVSKERLDGSLVVCNLTTLYTANGTHVCNISGQTGTFMLRVRSSRSPFKAELTEWIEVKLVPLLNLIGQQEGALISFFIMLVIITTGIVSPVVVVIMTVFAIIVMMFLGLFTGITFTFFVIAAILGLIISLKVRG
jgi:hypothetical protein